MPSTFRMTAVALGAAGALGAIAAPAGAHGGGGLGVVVAQKDADTFVVANRGGQLRAIDAATPPAVGSVVKVKARKGVAKRIRVVGTATKARIRGIVTTSAADAFTLTGKPDDTAAVVVKYAAPLTQPGLGRRLSVTVTISGSDLTATGVKTGGCEGTEVEGTITAVDTAARTLTLQPESGTPVVISVPASVDLAQFTVGEKVELKVLLQADGTYVLRGADRRGAGADDHPKGDDHPNGDDRGRGRGSDDDQNDDRGRGHGRDD